MIAPPITEISQKHGRLFAISGLGLQAGLNPGLLPDFYLLREANHGIDAPVFVETWAGGLCAGLLLLSQDERGANTRPATSVALDIGLLGH